MRQETFWAIVESCRAEAGADSEHAARLVLRRLRALSPEELIEYERWWLRAQAELFTWPVRDAATLLLGPFDDETFLSVQDWIVSHGRPVLRRVLDDPDHLVELAGDRHNARVDWFRHLPAEVHIALTGRPCEVDGDDGPEEPCGRPVDLRDAAQLRQRFPRLMAYLDGNTWIARPWDDR
ncbi:MULTISPECIES: DUF4240 domain-containing protein [unclassified Micromonospora]|uniref:DUF4240 domain-containing protein n=1 Tax=unclassified Micromonospora TaxID=2617518 RepID=UPI002FF231F4